MHTETLFVRRAATVSPQEAKQRLAEKYPGYLVKDFRIESGEDGEFYTASVVKKADHPEVGVEPLSVGPEPEAPSLDDSPEPPKEDKPEEKGNSGLEHKLDKIMDMLQTLVGGDETPADHAGGESPVDSKPLPPPVKEPHPAMGGGGGGAMGLFGKKLQLTVERENSKDVKLATAKAELDAEFAPHGFKVAKMVRKDDKIIAGLVRNTNDLPPFMKKDEDKDEDDKSDEKKPGEKSDEKDDKNENPFAKKEDHDK